jgi:ligand-binding sensor domain-containing protein
LYQKSTKKHTMKPALLTISFLFSALFSVNAQSLNWLHYDDGNSPLPSNTIYCILAVDNGIWAGTDDGLAFYDGSDWTIYTSETSELPDNDVRDIHEDNWGNTWVATNKGVVRINENGWTVFDESNSGLPLNLVRSVTTDPEGNLWVGTWGGGIAKMIGSEWTTYNTSNSDIPHNGVFTVELDYSGSVWLGMYNSGVSKFNGLSWETFDMANSELPDNNVRSITFDGNETVWFGTDDGLARKTDAGVWQVYTYQNIGYSFHRVFEGVQESEGKVFFGTDGGLISFDQTNFTVTTTQNSNLKSNIILCITQTLNGNLWLGTGNDGISIFSPQGTLGVKDIVSNSNLLSIYPNPAGDEMNFNLDQSINGNLGIEVRNAIGQTIVTQKVTHSSGQQHPLNLNQLTPGVYHLTVQSSKALITKTFYKL